MSTSIINGLKSKILARRPWIEEKHPRVASLAKRLVHTSRRMKQPSFYAAIPLYPLRVALRSNMHLFWSIYQLSGLIGGGDCPKRTWEEEIETKIRKISHDLKEYGVAK